MSSESKSESKGGESKTNFMDIVQEFCMSSELEQEFEKFARDHSDVFLQSLDMKEGEEHPMQFHTVYLEYLETFERRIESFIAQVLACVLLYFSSWHICLTSFPARIHFSNFL